MSNSKIHTRSYFIKRLRDSGYFADRVSWEYSETDSRKWSIVVDHGGSSIIVTCYKDHSFSFYDGVAYVNNYLKINTDSIEVLISLFNDWGIVNKHFSYGKAKIVETP